MTFEEAYDLIESIELYKETEKVPLIRSLNRILAEEVVSDTDMPPFDKSAMDGFACKKADINGELIIVDEIRAGQIPGKPIDKGQCARIMTGAVLPDGCDYVLMKEHAEVSGNLVRATGISDQSNICYRGEDVKTGALVFQKGRRILPADMAMLAATGYSMPLVYKIPEVAVISTGNELTEPGQKPGISEIRNSNGYQLAGQVMQFGSKAHYLGIVRDDKKMLTEKIGSAIEKYPLVILSGGVSVGDYDFVPVVLRELGISLWFHGLNMKPGKHFLLGVKENHFVAGMPGNPVSSFVIFEVLLKPLLARMMGMTNEGRTIKLPIGVDYSRKKTGTLFFVPVEITRQGTVLPVEYHGSAHIDSYTRANGIMEIQVGVSNIKEGEMVNVRQI